MPYRAPLADIRFLLDHIVDYAQVTQTPRFAEAGADSYDPILTEAARLTQDVIAPLNRAGDLHPARLENGVVRTSPGFAEGYRVLAEGGWISLAAGEDHGGMALPLTIASAVNEMLAGACLALQLNPLLTQGQIEALEAHASPELKALYLPKLISGAWNGTMNLTEPQAGSDVGALRAKADPLDDGSYAISGQKIFITWGDTDFLENTVHLVLARLPDGAAGTKGISLFLVPKVLPNEDGTLGARNSLQVVSLEHKLGIHGSPTCVMQFDGAKGWLVGAPHKGMAAMFTMMNNARLGVGLQGVGVAEAAYQQALDYAISRVQGPTPLPHEQGISAHADVRRALASMKAQVFSARAIGMACAVALDMARATGSAEWQARAAFLTPIAKAYGTDTGCFVASEAVQIHGGMGFIEETGVAQYLRDVRITPIYEGTNGIQAMDLVARKMADGGDAAYRLLGEIEANARAARATHPDLAEALWQGHEALREATEAMLAHAPNDRFAGAVPYLRAFALVLGGHYHLKAALAEGGAGPRAKLARIAILRVMQEYGGLLAQARYGAEDLYALTLEDLAI